MTEIIKMQKLSNSIRVIIEPFYNRGRVMYRIAAQQLTNEDSYMDIRTGGWYDTQAIAARLWKVQSGYSNQWCGTSSGSWKPTDRRY